MNIKFVRSLLFVLVSLGSVSSFAQLRIKPDIWDGLADMATAKGYDRFERQKIFVHYVLAREHSGQKCIECLDSVSWPDMKVDCKSVCLDYREPPLSQLEKADSAPRKPRNPTAFKELSEVAGFIDRFVEVWAMTAGVANPKTCAECLKKTTSTDMQKKCGVACAVPVFTPVE